MVEPRQFLDLEGCFNFRDLGGYRTADGRMVARRRLYRADSLHRLTAAGRAAFDQLEIATVIDLRTADEITRSRWAPPESWTGCWLHHPLRSTIPDWTDVPVERAADPELAVEHYQQTVRAGANVLVDVFTELAAPNALPAVFHCAAGKDRTGIVAGFLLRLLGVSIEAVSADYALSEEATARWEASVASGVPDDTQTSWSYVPPALMTADASVMHALLEWVDGENGSVTHLLRRHGLAAGVPDLLRDQLLTQRR